MSETFTLAANEVTKFSAKYFTDFVRKERFFRYTGATYNNVFVMIEEAGKQKINIPVIRELNNDPIVRNATLSGNEEEINQGDFALEPYYQRFGITITKHEKDKPAYDLYIAAKPLLTKRGQKLVREQKIEALGAIYNGTTYADYGTASAAMMDTWNENNSDRILYGAAPSNITVGDHTTSLGTIDTTNDKMSKSIIDEAKMLAQQADPLIQPLSTTEDDEFFVMFVGQYGMKALRADLGDQLKDAETRGKNNPLFRGGDLMWNNVLVREIPELTGRTAWGTGATADGLNDAGNSSSTVEMGFLCGTGAVGYAMSQRPIPVTESADYGFRKGLGMEMKHELKKMFFKDNNKQHGVVTVFYSKG